MVGKDSILDLAWEKAGRYAVMHNLENLVKIIMDNATPHVGGGHNVKKLFLNIYEEKELEYDCRNAAFTEPRFQYHGSIHLVFSTISGSQGEI